MRLIVLGSGAGGGLPQWNCRCENCRLAFAGDPAISPRTQASIALSANGVDWVVLSASPDIRQQIIATPELHPRSGLRHSPIRGVVAPSGDIDNIAGLLTLRERQPFILWATAATLRLLEGGPFDVLNQANVTRKPIRLNEAVDTGCGFTLTPFSTPGKIPLYKEGAQTEESLHIGGEGEETIGLEISDGRTRGYYIPACARITPALRQRLSGADLLLFDGTTFENDEMIQQGVSDKTAWRMGHVAMNGPQGSIAALADVVVARRIFIHINNTNPVLRAVSAARKTVEALGWEVGYDGMRIDL